MNICSAGSICIKDLAQDLIDYLSKLNVLAQMNLISQKMRQLGLAIRPLLKEMLNFEVP